MGNVELREQVLEMQTHLEGKMTRTKSEWLKTPIRLCFSELHRCSSLKSLESDDLFGALPKLPSPRYCFSHRNRRRMFYLTHSLQFIPRCRSNRGIESLRSLGQHLISLNLADTVQNYFRLDFLQTIGSLTRLEELNLSNYFSAVVQVDVLQLVDALKHLTNLRSLNLRGNMVILAERSPSEVAGWLSGLVGLQRFMEPNWSVELSVYSNCKELQLIWLDSVTSKHLKSFRDSSLFLEKLSSVTIVSHDNQLSLLACAARQNDLLAVNWMLCHQNLNSSFDPNFRFTPNHLTPLMVAPKIEIITALVDRGADVNATVLDEDGFVVLSPLMAALKVSREATDFLLACGAVVDLQSIATAQQVQLEVLLSARKLASFSNLELSRFLDIRITLVPRYLRGVEELQAFIDEIGVERRFDVLTLYREPSTGRTPLHKLLGIPGISKPIAKDLYALLDSRVLTAAVDGSLSDKNGWTPVSSAPSSVVELFPIGPTQNVANTISGESILSFVSVGMDCQEYVDKMVSRFPNAALLEGKPCAMERILSNFPNDQIRACLNYKHPTEENFVDLSVFPPWKDYSSPRSLIVQYLDRKGQDPAADVLALLIERGALVCSTHDSDYLKSAKTPELAAILLGTGQFSSNALSSAIYHACRTFNLPLFRLLLRELRTRPDMERVDSSQWPFALVSTDNLQHAQASLAVEIFSILVKEQLFDCSETSTFLPHLLANGNDELKGLFTVAVAAGAPVASVGTFKYLPRANPLRRALLWGSFHRYFWCCLFPLLVLTLSLPRARLLSSAAFA